jgi:hypothetical protein
MLTCWNLINITKFWLKITIIVWVEFLILRLIQVSLFLKTLQNWLCIWTLGILWQERILAHIWILRTRTNILNYFILIFLNEDIKEVKLSFVVHFLKSVKFWIISITVCDYSWLTIMFSNSFHSPFTIYESNIPKLIIFLHTNRTTKLSELIF